MLLFSPELACRESNDAEMVKRNPLTPALSPQGRGEVE